ncbi:hypothetical protein HZB89_00595 [archaeon]|nr:hypothetical protein [archaeon]
MRKPKIIRVDFAKLAGRKQADKALKPSVKRFGFEELESPFRKEWKKHYQVLARIKALKENKSISPGYKEALINAEKHELRKVKKALDYLASFLKPEEQKVKGFKFKEFNKNIRKSAKKWIKDLSKA